MKINWDGLGIATSLLCAIHCAVLPLLLSSLPFFGMDIVNNVYFEWGMIALAFFVGIAALWHGYKTHHHSLMPATIFTAGFVILFLKQFFQQQEVFFLIPAVILIVSAHLINFRLCRVSKCASPHHAH